MQSRWKTEERERERERGKIRQTEEERTKNNSFYAKSKTL